ncbi:single-stranded DNA-binding protein [Gracilibacillus sp. YIM 98692]|uniref:single-stranded DNA-binding protein n=1 Tax=Gracilibacillus sp. YIM 98692 TaxID=2663532 RepID=UPI0013D6C118|nr:single-stranded DNA-binding protein [Gracilibacillus sp. YIM 98692]
MLNRVVLVGRLTKDPDLRYTLNGVSVANFTISCNRPFSNQQGQRDADFINCVTWRGQAESLANYMEKGNIVGVDGRLQSRSFDGDDGKKVFVTEVVADSIQFLEPRNNGSKNQNYSSGRSAASPNQPSGQNQSSHSQSWEQIGEPIDIGDDGLPF